MLVKLNPTEATTPGPWILWLWFDLLLEQIRAHLFQPAMLEGDEQVSFLELAALANLRCTLDSQHIYIASK